MYTVIVSLPENLNTLIEPYRQQYDPLARVIPPHISLIDPFQFVDSEQILFDHLNEVGEIHAPIKVFLAGWDAHEGKNYQLHLPMTTGHNELMTLHYDLLGGPLNYLAGKIKEYWPRVIFGQFTQKDEFETAKQNLARFAPKFVVRVKHFELWQRNEMGQPWRMGRKFGLKATLAGRARRAQTKQ